jgi:hypothetical protein
MEEITIPVPAGLSAKLSDSAFRLGLEVDALLREVVMIAADAGTVCAFKSRDRFDLLLGRMGASRDR